MAAVYLVPRGQGAHFVEIPDEQCQFLLAVVGFAYCTADVHVARARCRCRKASGTGS